jgi:hypothetical protein
MGPPRSSKKRPQANRAHWRVKEILALRRHMMRLEKIAESQSSGHPNYAEKKAKSAEDSGHYSIRSSADNAASPFRFSSCE